MSNLIPQLVYADCQLRFLISDSSKPEYSIGNNAFMIEIDIFNNILIKAQKNHL